MDPIDWAAWTFGKIGHWGFVIVATLVLAALALAWMRGVEQYRASQGPVGEMSGNHAGSPLSAGGSDVPVGEPVLRVSQVGDPVPFGAAGGSMVPVSVVIDTTGIRVGEVENLIGELWVETRYAKAAILASASELNRAGERKQNRLVFGFHSPFPPAPSVDWLPKVFMQLPPVGERATFGGRISRAGKGFQEYRWWLESRGGRVTLHGGAVQTGNDSQVGSHIPVDGILDWRAPFISYSTPDLVSYFAGAVRFTSKNLGDRAITLDDAFVTSATTGVRLGLSVEIMNKNVGTMVQISDINPIPPQAEITLIMKFPTDARGDGLSEVEFMRKWGRFDFVARYGGIEVSQTFDERFTAARFRAMRGVVASRPSVTTKEGGK